MKKIYTIPVHLKALLKKLKWHGTSIDNGYEVVYGIIC